MLESRPRSCQEKEKGAATALASRRSGPHSACQSPPRQSTPLERRWSAAITVQGPLPAVSIAMCGITIKPCSNIGFSGTKCESSKSAIAPGQKHISEPCERWAPRNLPE